MRILGIDPGPRAHGYALLDTSAGLLCCGQDARPDLLPLSCSWNFAVVEMFEPRGQRIDQHSVDTIFETGRLWVRLLERADSTPALITRRTVQMHFCGRTDGDAAVNAVLRDRFAQTGGGKVPAVGTKSQPGPLYAIRMLAAGQSGHVWPALAVAVCYAERAGIVCECLRADR